MPAMTAEAITARLRELARLSAAGPSPMQRGVDMSAAAIAARLRELSDVSALCAKLEAIGAAARRRR
ncbi:MAG: hypothetical protein KIT84_39705 [Labilithrix sp.]|nr:hypothetical protein [Labilithrix sp.]MCW5817190.1 hypothetical protein [Labilithrix sp.]